MRTLTGGCLCGKVRYTANVETVRGGLCHCTSCQKTSGSAFSVNLFVPVASLQFEGDDPVSYADATPESGNTVTRTFCRTCGSSLSSETAAFPGMVILKGGSLDDTSAIRPELQVWTRSKQDWLQPDPNLPALPKGRGS